MAISDLRLERRDGSEIAQGFRLAWIRKGTADSTRLDPQNRQDRVECEARSLRPRANRLFASAIGGGTAIPGAVFSGSVDGHLRATRHPPATSYGTRTPRASFETVNGKAAQGGSMDVAGPAIVDGMVFVNSGYGQWGGMPGNVLLAFSVQ